MLVTVTAGRGHGQLPGALPPWRRCRLALPELSAGLGKASLLKPDAGQESAEGGAVGRLVDWRPRLVLGCEHEGGAVVDGDRDLDQAITIGGAPARLLTMQCPSGSGFLVEIAVTVHHGTAFVFASQHQPGTPVHYPADRAAFRNFLADIRLQR